MLRSFFHEKIKKVSKRPKGDFRKTPQKFEYSSLGHMGAPFDPRPPP